MYYTRIYIYHGSWNYRFVRKTVFICLSVVILNCKGKNFVFLIALATFKVI